MTRENLLLFLQESMRLKRMVRSGWIYSGIPPAYVESVADHSQFVTLITMLICFDELEKGNKIDLEKALIIATIHDLSESVSQDIDRRVRKFSPEKYDAFKHEMDREALNSLLEKLPHMTREKLYSYFEEFQEKKTIEARIVTEADRLETILQMDNYSRNGFSNKMFGEFLINFKQEMNNFEFDFVKKIAKELLEGK